jgi:two-component system CheB/CheR fusion protein
MALRGLSVLLVEDHPDHRELGRTLLTHLGARVDVAEDGERGLEQMRKKYPDLVLCDLLMPHMDGYEFARRVRRIPDCERVRLVALTCLHDDTAYLRTWCAGFDAHLEKPVTLAKLNEVAERFMLTRPARRPQRRRKAPSSSPSSPPRS